MLEIIAKYWLDFLLGAIATGLTIACKKIYKLYNDEKKHQRSEMYKELRNDLQQLIMKSNEQSIKADEELQKQINVMKSGILSIQGKNFREDCRNLLSPDKEFTLKEFESLQQEHAVYKALGGNHEGDTLFDLVTKKAANVLTDDK